MPYVAESRKINVDTLVTLCGGNWLTTLDRCRDMGKITINISVKSIERELCDRMIMAGCSNSQIVNTLDISIQRVIQRRKKVDE